MVLPVIVITSEEVEASWFAFDWFVRSVQPVLVYLLFHLMSLLGYVLCS